MSEQIPEVSNLSTTDQISIQLHKAKPLKLTISLLLILSFLIYNNLKSASPIRDGTCLMDRGQRATQFLNAMMKNGSDNIFLGIGQVIIDLTIIFLCTYWILKVKHFRVIGAYALFFGLRALFLNIQKFPFSDQLVWHNPGFLSLTVPYDHTRDFFYSGHTGTLFVVILQLFKLKMYKMVLILFICFLYIISLLVATRVHYTSDIIGGIIFSLFSWQVAHKGRVQIDKVFSFSYKIGKYVQLKYNSLSRSTEDLQQQIDLNNKQSGKPMPIILNEEIIYDKYNLGQVLSKQSTDAQIKQKG